MRYRFLAGSLFGISLHLFLSLFFSSTVSAELMINEYLPYPETSDIFEWVEFFNPDETSINLANYYFDDNIDPAVGGQKKDMFGILPPKGKCSTTFSNYLNNDKDSPTLFKLDGTVVDTHTYTSSSVVKGLTFSRVPDGGGWMEKQNPTRTEISCESLATPTPQPTASPSPSPFVEESEAKYTVNKPRENSGEEVSNVKIYLNDYYTGNYAEETYTFCALCKCGSNKVNCGFGTHKITLQKNGYDNWTRTFEIKAGDDITDNPVMSLCNLETPEPTPTPTPKSSTPKPTPTLKTASPSPEAEEEIIISSTSAVLGIFNDVKEDELSSPEAKNKSSTAFVSFLLFGLGIIFVGFSLSSYYLNKKGIINSDEQEAV